MRRPRLRFSLRTLLFAGLVVAANCWALRSLCFRWEDTPGRWTTLVPEEVGIIPFVNVALISTLVWGGKSICSRLRKDVVRTTPGWSAVAFFSLNFLLWGGLVYLLVPDAWDRYTEACYPLVNLTSECLEGVGGHAQSEELGLASDCFTQALATSGPLLLAVCVGTLLARRAARTTPPRRFRTIALAVSFGLASVALAFSIEPRPFQSWIDVELEIRVLDETTRQPISAAFVHVSDPFSRSEKRQNWRGLTDTNGQARLSVPFFSSGERNVFRPFGSYSPWGRWLEVSAANHETKRVPLTEPLGLLVDLAHPALVTIALAPGDTPEAPFRATAGSYELGHMCGVSVQITPDGRFTWREWSCNYSVQEYGYIKKYNGKAELELVPIRDAGGQTNAAINTRYRLVTWGNHLFFCEANDHVLADLCRQALLPNHEPYYTVSLRILPRGSDGEEPHTGLPRLSLRVWAHFVLDELNPLCEVGSVRRALERVVPRFPGLGI